MDGWGAETAQGSRAYTMMAQKRAWWTWAKNHIKARGDACELHLPFHLDNKVSCKQRENDWPLLARKMQLWLLITAWEGSGSRGRVRRNIPVYENREPFFTSRSQCVLQRKSLRLFPFICIYLFSGGIQSSGTWGTERGGESGVIGNLH